MFEALLGNVDADFVRYITHVEATAVEEPAEEDQGLEGAVTNAEVVAPGVTNFRPTSGEEGTAQTG